jgi:hypothetical protein
VVLRLRGRTSLGATFLKVMAGYAERLAAVDGRLYLSGLDPSVTEHLRHTRRLDGPVRTFEATPLVGESTEAHATPPRYGWCESRPTDDRRGPCPRSGRFPEMKPPSSAQYRANQAAGELADARAGAGSGGAG